MNALEKAEQVKARAEAAGCYDVFIGHTVHPVYGTDRYFVFASLRGSDGLPIMSGRMYSFGHLEAFIKQYKPVTAR